jgi:hypothetical protein
LRLPEVAPSRAVLVLLGAAWLCGCAISTQRFGRPIDADRIASIQVGTSTKADVLREFGPPSAYSALPVVPARQDPSVTGTDDLLARAEAESRMFVYEYREDRENFLTIILFTRFRREVVSDRLMVFFDERDVVRYVAFSRQTQEPEAQ